MSFLTGTKRCRWRALAVITESGCPPCSIRVLRSRIMVRSPLRWAGGKNHLRSLFAAVRNDLEDDTRVVDPFLGGANILLMLQPACFLAADVNFELVNFYIVCRDFPTELHDAVA